MAQDRRDLRRRLFILASQQGGYFSAAQARSVGYSYQSQAHHVSAGTGTGSNGASSVWPNGCPNRTTSIIRWTLWAKGDAVVSHETALAVHGIGEFESPRVHLTVPPDFTKRDPAVTLHRVDLHEDDVETRPGSGSQLARAINDAVDSGQITVRRLRTRAEAVDLKGALHIERAISRIGQTS